MDNKEKFDVLLQMRSDCRSEIEQRVKQRDDFSIQFMVSASAVLALGFLDFAFAPYLFFLLPVISIFYSIQIFYSYSIHNRLHNFLYKQLEPEIGRLLGLDDVYISRHYWENYCEVDSKLRVIKTPGIRESFFRVCSYVIPFISVILFVATGITKGLFATNEKIYHIIFGSVLFIGTTLLNYIPLLRFNNKKTNIKQFNRISRCSYLNKKILQDTRLKKAIFLDRDGTIHVDKVQTHKIADLEFFDDTISALKRLQEQGYILVIVTNQDGLKQKKYTEAEFNSFNDEILRRLNAQGIEIAAIYYSPYEKEDNHISFKPRPGMLVRAKNELNIDIFHSYIIGDQVHDIKAGRELAMDGIMVTTGIYPNDDYRASKDFNVVKPKTAKSLTEACDMIFGE